MGDTVYLEPTLISAYDRKIIKEAIQKLNSQNIENESSQIDGYRITSDYIVQLLHGPSVIKEQSLADILHTTIEK